MSTGRTNGKGIRLTKAAVLYEPRTPIRIEDLDIEPPGEGEDIMIDGWHLLQDRALIGSWHGAARARVDFLWILDLYRQGKIKLDELVSRTRPLDEINEAFEDMNRGKVARTVLVFG